MFLVCLPLTLLGWVGCSGVSRFCSFYQPFISHFIYLDINLIHIGFLFLILGFMRKEENSFFIWIFLSHSNLWLLSSFFIILCMALYFEFNNWCILTILTSMLCVNTSWNIIVFYLRQTEYSIEWHKSQLMIEMLFKGIILLALFGLVLTHVCSAFGYLALSFVFIVISVVCLLLFI